MSDEEKIEVVSQWFPEKEKIVLEFHDEDTNERWVFCANELIGRLVKNRHCDWYVLELSDYEWINFHENSFIRKKTRQEARVMWNQIQEAGMVLESSQETNE